MLGHKDKNKKFHPHGSGNNGIREEDLNISVKGNNDVIKVDTKKPTSGMKGNREVESYDKGIEIERVVTSPKEKLGKDEYYALMVTDTYHKNERPKNDYVNFEKGYIGLERTSPDDIYVSKDFYKRKNLLRGETVIVKVSPDARTYEL